MVTKPGQDRFGSLNGIGREDGRIQQVIAQVGQEHIETRVPVGIAITNGTVAKLLDGSKKFALHRFGLA